MKAWAVRQECEAACNKAEGVWRKRDHLPACQTSCLQLYLQVLKSRMESFTKSLCFLCATLTWVLSETEASISCAAPRGQQMPSTREHGSQVRGHTQVWKGTSEFLSHDVIHQCNTQNHDNTGLLIYADCVYSTKTFKHTYNIHNLHTFIVFRKPTQSDCKLNVSAFWIVCWAKQALWTQCPVFREIISYREINKEN